MAIIANTATTFSGSPGLAGIREELSDIIYNTSPTDTPFLTGIGKQKVGNTLYEWQTDTLAADDNTNAQLQGDDMTTFPAASVTTRLNNRTQISRKLVIVDGTVEAIGSAGNLAGRKSELAMQMMKRGKELKNDMEAILVGTNQAKVTGTTTTAPKTASVLSWVKTNTSKASDGSDPSASDGTGTRTDGTTRTYTEALLKSVLQSVWSSSSEEPDAVQLGGTLKQTMSTFTGNANRQIDARGRALMASIDVYDYDFGRVKVVPNRHMRTRDVLIFDYSMWAVAYLRPIQPINLAKTGDAEKRAVLAEYGLVAKNERSTGGVFDLG